MDEENRILNLAERALLREKGAGRAEYADQEAANKARQEEIKGLKDEIKDLKKTIDDQKQSPDKDAETIKRQADKIAELTAQIAQITAENAEKQRELEEELEQEKAKRKEAEIITPKMLEAAFEKIDELEGRLKEREEPKIEPEPKPAKDDNLNIYGYKTYTPEPRRRLDDFKPRPREDDRPKYEPEPEPIREPEKIEPEPFRDPWEKIEEEMNRWQKLESEVEKKILSTAILQRLDSYEKSGWDIPPHRQLTIDSYRRAASYDPADAIHRERERKLETERKRRAAAELEKKYEDERGKNVKQETDARQHNIKKKKDELEMGIF